MPVTHFQACFANAGVLTPKSAFLVVERDPLPFFARPFAVVWHFDDTIRESRVFAPPKAKTTPTSSH